MYRLKSSSFPKSPLFEYALQVEVFWLSKFMFCGLCVSRLLQVCFARPCHTQIWFFQRHFLIFSYSLHPLELGLELNKVIQLCTKPFRYISTFLQLIQALIITIFTSWSIPFSHWFEMCLHHILLKYFDLFYWKELLLNRATITLSQRPWSSQQSLLHHLNLEVLHCLWFFFQISLNHLSLSFCAASLLCSP